MDIEALSAMAVHVDSDQAEELLDAVEHGVDEERIAIAAREFVRAERDSGRMSDLTALRLMKDEESPTIIEVELKELQTADNPLDGDEVELPVDDENEEESGDEEFPEDS